MELIDEIEPNLRGVYGGTVGYFAKNGDMDQAIAIRTIVFSDGKYCFQAGAELLPTACLRMNLMRSWPKVKS